MNSASVSAPSDNITGRLSLNILGRVPVNPIDEIFYENRGRPRQVQADDGTSFRMYPRSFGQVVEGWTKGIAIGFDATPWWAVLGVAAWVTSLAGGCLTSPWFVLASWLQLAVFARRVGRFRWWAVAVYPAWVLLLVAVLARSTWRRRRGGEVTWKGRRLRPDQAA